MARDPYRYFRIEARELLEQLGKAVLDLEGSAAPTEPLARLLRLAHTLKGAARVVKQPAMADCAHGLEGAFTPYRERGAVPRAVVDKALKLIDQMGEELAQLPAEETPKGAEGRAQEPSVKEAAALEPARTVRAAVDDVDRLLRGFAEVRGELSVIRRAVADPVLARSMERAERELNEMRALTERLRLVPAGALFNALERLLRDSARAVGKMVEFEARGADVRLDGDVLDT
ncbi:MAG: Hpt domain-containing protein, partial [Burkholderiales bacterium]